jgi:tetratricopeptide (TPR) repeat protein
MQRDIRKYAARIMSIIKCNIPEFVLTIKESPQFLIIITFILLFLISELIYIYSSPAPIEYRSEVFGFVSILIGLVGLLYALYSTIVSGKQLKQTSNELGKMQIDYWNTRGIDQIRKNDFYDASQSYQMAININSKDVRIWINIAGSLFQQKMYDDALKAINKAIEINPEKSEVWNSKGVILREKAMASTEYDIELDTEITKIESFKIDIPISQNIIYAENTILNDAENRSKLKDETKSLLAQSEFAFKKAIELRHAKSKSGYDINQDWLDKYVLAGIWSNLGTVYSYQGDNKKAIDTYNEAIKLNPRYVEAWIDKGHALLSDMRLIEAVDAFDKAIKIDPMNSRAWGGKGNAYEEMGQIYLNDAIHAFDKSLEYDKFNLNTLSRKGFVLFKMRKYDEAVKVSEMFLEIDPFNLIMARNKCLSLLGLNKYEDAFRESNIAIKLYYQHAFAWYNKYKKLYDIGKYDDAITAYDNYLKLIEENSVIYSIIGDASFNSSLKYPTRLWDALIGYTEAIRLNPLNIYSWVGRSMVLYVLGYPEQSKNAYLHAYRLYILSNTPYQYV